MAEVNSLLTQLLKLNKEQLEEIGFRVSVALMEMEVVDE